MLRQFGSSPQLNFLLMFPPMKRNRLGGDVHSSGNFLGGPASAISWRVSSSAETEAASAGGYRSGSRFGRKNGANIVRPQDALNRIQKLFTTADFSTYPVPPASSAALT